MKMEKITSVEQLLDEYGDASLNAAKASLGITHLMIVDSNLWMIREQCRINSGEYTPIKVEGDDLTHFLHVSADDPGKVAYTKDADKGRADIQTRTTLAKYCEKFELDISTASTPQPTPAQQEPVVNRVVRELQEEGEPRAGDESNIVYCMHQLENALSRVAELKNHLRSLLG